MNSYQNYAEYRKQFKSAYPSATEPQVFSNWMKWEIGGWEVQSTPMKGVDGRYHMVYLSERNDGLIYVGKHDTDNPNDEYVGSGLNVKYSTQSGYAFKKIPLAFFPNSDAALAMEKIVVTEDFIKHPSVLNQDLGGDSTRHVTEKPSNSNPLIKSEAKKRTTTAISFSELFNESKSGDKTVSGRKLIYIKDRRITCTVLDDWQVYGAFGNGKKMNLSAYTGQIIPGFRGNPLFLWEVDGERLDALSTLVKSRRYGCGS